VLSQIDPERIYVENIRSFYNLPVRVARFLCEMAVKQHFFEKRYGVMCPTCKRIVSTYETESEIPVKVLCNQCEMLERESSLFEPSKNDIIAFYKLIKKK
jgi:hypothetical protein